jgi:hypothetical protein
MCVGTTGADRRIELVFARVLVITAGIKAHRQISQLAVGIVGWYSGILEDRRLLSLGTVIVDAPVTTVC